MPTFGDGGQADALDPGDEYDYIVYVWKGPVIVLHQNCEIAHAHPEDSRVVIAPLVSPDAWPDGPWKELRENSIPGYYYLPATTPEEAEALGTEIEESVIVFSSVTTISRELLTHQRVARVRHEKLVELQDGYARATTVRGLASTRELDGLSGKRIVKATESSLTSPGPVRLAKILLTGGDPEEEDEVTVAWGLRKARED